MRVTAVGPLRSATGEKTVELEFAGGTVAEALAAFAAAYPRAESQLYDADGDLRPSVRVSLDGDRAEPGDECPPDAELTVVPAVQGGLD
jgi:molybdopterin synthase sulfur carrier subunit